MLPSTAALHSAYHHRLPPPPCRPPVTPCASPPLPAPPPPLKVASQSLHIKLEEFDPIILVSVKPKTSSARGPNQKVKSREALEVFASHTFEPAPGFSEDLMVFLNDLKPNVLSKLEEEKGAIKCYAIVKATLIRTISEGEDVTITPYFCSDPIIELLPQTFPDHVEEAYAKIIASFEKSVQMDPDGSWTSLNTYNYRLCKVSSSCLIQLHRLASRTQSEEGHSQYQDQKCLVLCLLAHKMNIHWKNKPEHISHYKPHENTIQLGSVECPIPVEKIPIIERLNNLRLNVFGYEDNEVYPSTFPNEKMKSVLIFCGLPKKAILTTVRFEACLAY